MSGCMFSPWPTHTDVDTRVGKLTRPMGCGCAIYTVGVRFALEVLLLRGLCRGDTARPRPPSRRGRDDHV
eukprot:scaffold232213_cov30-Tisochrysis_lutea.AAC.2